jgi:hypothetical protein
MSPKKSQAPGECRIALFSITRDPACTAWQAGTTFPVAFPSPAACAEWGLHLATDRRAVTRSAGLFSAI